MMLFENPDSFSVIEIRPLTTTAHLLGAGSPGPAGGSPFRFFCLSIYSRTTTEQLTSEHNFLLLSFGNFSAKVSPLALSTASIDRKSVV